MSDLKTVSTEALQLELARRALPRKRPHKAENIDWNPLLKLLEQNMDHLEEEGCRLKDLEHYVYELAFTCVYGDEFWAWREEVERE